MERKIGETFEYEGKILQVKASVRKYSCIGCIFGRKCSSRTKLVSGICGNGRREDGNDVIFVEVAKEQSQDEQPQKLNLCDILKDCPKGTEFWSDNYGEVKFIEINPSFEEPILTRRADGYTASYTKEGWHSICFPANCLLWPSRDCRDWTKFTAPWPKKERFNPKTLKAFDRVIVKNIQNNIWHIQYFSHINEKSTTYPFFCLHDSYAYCIPYNDDTKHLVGTTGEAPEFYKYWED